MATAVAHPRARGDSLLPASPQLHIRIPQRNMTPCKRLVLGRPLQRGAHGEVRLAKTIAGAQVAVKIAHDDPESRERLLTEAHVLQTVLPPHANVVATYTDLPATTCDRTGSVYLPLQLCDTDLLELLLHKDGLRPSSLGRFARQLVAAVHHCHSHNVYHLDLKPENVLVDMSEGSLKLADFGMACVLDRKQAAAHTGQHGSASYAAPEVWNYAENCAAYSASAADVWSLGAVLFTMAFRRRPWEDVHMDDKDFRFYVQHGRFKLYETDPVVDGRTVDLLYRMMALDPVARPTLEQVEVELGVRPAPKPKTAPVEVSEAAAPKDAVPSCMGGSIESPCSTVCSVPACDRVDSVCSISSIHSDCIDIDMDESDESSFDAVPEDVESPIMME